MNKMMMWLQLRRKFVILWNKEKLKYMKVCSNYNINKWTLIIQIRALHAEARVTD